MLAVPPGLQPERLEPPQTKTQPEEDAALDGVDDDLADYVRQKAEEAGALDRLREFTLLLG